MDEELTMNGARVVNCARGTRQIEVPRTTGPRQVEADWRDASGPTFHLDVIALTPHRWNGRELLAGYDAVENCWYIAAH